MLTSTLQPPTGTVTFLFTDIEGSTRLWEGQPEAMREALALHDEIVRASIEANAGYVFKTMGDAFFAAFHTAAEAAAAALDAQQSLYAECWQIEPPVRARMALHTGAAELRGSDYFGQPLNRAARLLSAGHGGQTLVAAATQELVRDTLPPGSSLADLGDASLKDLARPERVYQLNHPDLPSEFPPLKTLNSSQLPNNLPQQTTSFIGREKEIADIKALLLRSRLLTLVGAGGAGKTRLSLQAAADLLDGEGDGVWQVELAPLADPTLVPGAVAQVLGVKEAPGEPVRTTLVNALRAKSLLLVLDNCEHVLDACCSLATDLLRSCPGVHILATSREPLGAAGEQVYRIPSLSVPKQFGGGGGHRAHDAESLSTFESVRLFIERAKAVQPSFSVTDANAPAVAQLCAHLDGIPLAIELAAARVRSMAVEQVNARLDQRFKLLTGGSRMNLPRQQTLSALIDWSYDLLSEQERSLLGALSVFAGGWTLDAAEAVCPGDGTAIEGWEVLDLLTSLTDKSLVVYEDAPDASRYRLLETIREYSRIKLEETGETDSIKRRYAHWFIALAEKAQPHLAGPDAQVWLTRLETEHDNLRAVLTWAEQNVASSEDATSGLRLAVALWRFWDVRSHFSEGRRWLSSLQQQSSLARQAPDASLRAGALVGEGVLANAQSDYDASRILLTEGLGLYRELGDRTGVADALLGLVIAANQQNDYASAGVLLQEALGIQREMGDLRGISTTLSALAIHAANRGDVPAARALLLEGLALRREVGDQRGVAGMLHSLGVLANRDCHYDAAREYHYESLAIRREIDDAQGIARSLNALGYLASDQRDLKAAKEFYQESLEICRRIGDQFSTAVVLTNLATIVAKEDKHKDAQSLFQQSLEIYRKVGNGYGVALVLTNLGNEAFDEGDLAAARAYYEESLPIKRAVGEPLSLARSLNGLGSCNAVEKRFDEAGACFREALTHARGPEGRSILLTCITGMAEMVSNAGFVEAATRLWGASTALSEEIDEQFKPATLQRRDTQLAAARAALGKTDFDAAWAQGQALSWEKAAEYALSDLA